MTPSRHLIRIAALAALPVLLLAGAAAAQERSSGGFLDNLFSRGESAPRGQGQQGQGQQGQGQQGQASRGQQVAQDDPADLTVRLDRLENALRQLTGTLEQLQYRNQQLEMQLKRMQDDTEYRFQQLGSRGAGPGAPAPSPATPGRRSDVFDPAQRPNAPGAPRALGGGVAAPPPFAANEPPVGIPGGRAAGAPLDLSTLAGNAAEPPPGPMLNAERMPASQPPAQLPPPRNTNATAGAQAGAQMATLPPSASPQDEFDMAYGYVLHKDYALAEQAFRDFLRKYPGERLVPDAQYWLGESLYQRQRYRDAAESFLAVSTKYEKAGKAPDSLLRLGQSLAALNQKEAACATLAEVGRKYPRASASVKRGVTQEQQRAHC